MPTNLYGPGDNYHEKNSHVIPALLRRFHEAKMRELPKIEIWGSGNQDVNFYMLMILLREQFIL